MSNYTISVEEIVNAIWDEDHVPNDIPLNLPSFRTALQEDDQRIEYAIPFIFNFDYEYYGDAEDKKDLEKSILSDYYFREICCDNVARWQRLLRNRMHDIMPKYKQIYDSQMRLIASDYMNPYYIEETMDEEVQNNKNRQNTIQDSRSDSSTNQTNVSTDTNNTGTETSNEHLVNKYSDTPQALAETGRDYLTNMTVQDTNGTTDFENESTSTSQSSSTGTVTGERNTTGTEASGEHKDRDYTKIIKGNLGKMNNADLIKAYQNAIMNIEEAIIGELRDLFFQLY